MHLVSVARLRSSVSAAVTVLFLNHKPHTTPQKNPELVLPENGHLERVLAQTPKWGAFSLRPVSQRQKKCSCFLF